MQNFRRSMIRLLFVTVFLLFVAWIALKAMSYRGDWERMYSDWKQSSGRLGEKVEQLVKPMIDSVGPKVQEMVQSTREFLGGMPEM